MFIPQRRILIILASIFAAAAGVAAIVEIISTIRRHEALATPYVLGLIAMAFLLGGLIWRRREGPGADVRAEARTPNEAEARTPNEAEARTPNEAEARTPNEAKISLPADSIGSLFDLFPILVWRCGTDGKCNYFNHAFLAFTGRSLAEELGDGWTTGIHPEDAEHCLSTRAKAFQARTPFSIEYRLRHYDGQYHWILDVARPFYDVRGDLAGFIGSCFSLTERKQIETDMRLYQKAFEHAEDPITIVDRGLNYQAVNRTFLRFFNMRREDAIGRPVREIVGAEFYDAVHAQALAEALDGRVATRECLRHYPGVGDRFMSFVYIPLPEAGGGVGAIVLMSRDITAQKALDQEREVTVEMLRLLNTQEDSRTTMEGALNLMLNHSGCAGGGIRISDGTDFPFRVSQGLGADFLQTENTLFPPHNGQTRTDTDHAAAGGGRPRAELAGLCGEVLRGAGDAGRAGFTAGGSFWTGGLSETLPVAGAALGAPARGRCLAAGFESLALIPLK
ncbi:MAG: PAS domain-containing protein, partial [Candidatus Sumerlaeota bacterium]|nr:PAS domain-containing protein [Candidatus Sumerlaeota bacterium]